MLPGSATYDKKFLITALIGLALLVLAMKATGGPGFLLILPFILVGFGKNKTELLLWCVLATTVLTMTNSNIAPKDQVFSLANRGLYALVGGVMVLQMVGQRASIYLAPMLGILGYIAYMALISAFGWVPLISYLKLTLFVIVFFALYSVGNASATRYTVSPEKLRSVFLSFAIFLILGSIALIPFPAISMLNVQRFFLEHGYIPEGSLFTGMTLHSQALGPIVSIFSTFLLADLLFSLKRADKLYLLLLLLCPILIYKTGSRTAMGTYLAGMFFVTFLFMQARGIGAQWKNKALSALLLLGMAGGLAFMATPGLRQSAVKFIYKVRGDAVVEEQGFDRMISSRQGLIDHAMDNFKESPYIGNGFQVTKQLAQQERTSWKQYITAPVEKGVWVTAVLEEGGVFGMILFVIFLLTAFGKLLARHAVVGSSVFFVMVVANLGEFTIFSMSGMGGIFWAMTFMGLAIDAHRNRQQIPVAYSAPPIQPIIRRY